MLFFHFIYIKLYYKQYLKTVKTTCLVMNSKKNNQTGTYNKLNNTYRFL